MFGFAPKLTWKNNPLGEIRSVEEAIEIARDHGVHIPAEVVFFLDELHWLDHQTTPRGPKVTKATGELVTWNDLVNNKGKVPFLLRPDILESDEAIVAVIAHEVHELQGLEKLMDEGRLTIEEFGFQTSPAQKGSLHFQAWDVADQLVEAIRRRTNDS
jgi:hypothetical protein